MAGLYDSAGSVKLLKGTRRDFADFLFRAVLDLTFKDIMMVQPGLGPQIDASMSSSSSKEIAPKKNRGRLGSFVQLFTRAKFSAETVEVLRIHFNAEGLSSLCIVKRLCFAARALIKVRPIKVPGARARTDPNGTVELRLSLP
jgi:hypothetical protein